jgi:creatinine amidohydrolase
VNNSIPQAFLNLSEKKDINSSKVLLGECTRKEIRERLSRGELKIAIVPTASTEQHNEHLAMNMDTEAVLLISQLAALKVYPNAIVTPVVSVGLSPHWMNREGTLSLQKETFLNVVYDICDSLKTHGIRHILVLNGHGGNTLPLQEKKQEFKNKLGINFDICSYWDSISPEERKSFVDGGDVPGHSSEFETSIALAAFPERVRYQGVNHDKAKLKLTAQERKMDKDFYEESLLATREKGEKIINHSVLWVAEKLMKMIG